MKSTPKDESLTIITRNDVVADCKSINYYLFPCWICDKTLHVISFLALIKVDIKKNRFERGEYHQLE